MLKQTVKVKHHNGIHIRPAGDLCKLALEYKCNIHMKKENRICNVKSVISLLSACVKAGDEVEIICDGKDEKEAIKAITDLLHNM